jgi:hypothetical protein
MATRHKLSAVLAVLSSLCAWAGCDAIVGITDGQLSPGDDAASDSPGMDGTKGGDGTSGGDGRADAGSDAPVDALADVPIDAAPDVPTVWNDMANPKFWSTFDTSAVPGGGFLGEGAAFDGRYVYFAPSAYHGATVAGRYDTQGSFTAAASWSAYDTGKSFTGAIYDGKFVYFVSNVVMRYDPTTGFNSASSWQSFGVPGGDSGTFSLNGATFDGRYIYFAGGTTRYDTMGTFTDPTAWSTYSPALSCGDTYVGAVFDGRFVYFSPDSGGCVLRFDTQGTFTDFTSWDTFDLSSQLSMTATGFYGGAFDGRYVYFPQKPFGTPSTMIARYDSQAGFGIASSWSLFDTTGLGTNPGSYTATSFDGRNVYFLQGYAGGAPGFIARYDTTGAFGVGGDGGAWEGLSTAAFNSTAWDFGGAVFDGRYMYLAPNFNNVAARLDTKTPPSSPNLPDFHGSFY